MSQHHSHGLEATKQDYAGHCVLFHHFLSIKLELDMAVYGAALGVDDLMQDLGQAAAPNERARCPVGREGDADVQVLRFGETGG